MLLGFGGAFVGYVLVAIFASRESWQFYTFRSSIMVLNNADVVPSNYTSCGQPMTGFLTVKILMLAGFSIFISSEADQWHAHDTMDRPF